VIVEALSADTVVALLESLGAITLTLARLAARLEAQGMAREVAPAVSDALAITLPVTVFAATSYSADPAVAALVRCLRESASEGRPPRR
jgi:hypothetical protein